MDHDQRDSALSLAQHAVRLQTLLDRRIVDVLNAHGLSRSELDVLGALAERGDDGARPRELSSRLLLTTGGTSNILRRLHEDGLIEREADPSDARSQIIRLTTQGKEAAQRAGTAAGEVISQVLEPVDSSLLQSAAQLLHEVLTAMNDDAPVHRDPSGASRQP
ncbi:MarR family winged helix-turn-helix transcriptional regulator [Gryllotalpicola reticulitermitis]|uniref:MarR family winged helix-turn-helix transcriptional regulator n=1 Tax=Gryllotalpicola reticulitermitis TaxID=1184153 RepID=A0ABV8Q2P7_9MICO